MKNIRIIFSSILILSSISLAVEGESEKNTKYQFINDIYSESWALIIGINKYQNVDHLTYAVDDAVAVQEMLVDKYGFREDNIKLIIDEEATKDNIIKGFIFKVHFQSIHLIIPKVWFRIIFYRIFLIYILNYRIFYI